MEEKFNGKGGRGGVRLTSEAFTHVANENCFRQLVFVSVADENVSGDFEEYHLFPLRERERARAKAEIGMKI